MKNLMDELMGGYQDSHSPLGEPWVMLAFAAIFAIGVAYRNLSDKKQNNSHKQIR